MTPERWRQIEELYHSIRESSVERRAELLARADPELRSEVESLLALQDQSLPTLDAPTLTAMHSNLRFGPYQVESRIGQGGMGEVFRAIDTRLGRSVAIKVVDQQFNARFEREAKAIASLNHPHICTLYDIGPNYLVMELIEGETLSARLKSGPMPVEDALRYAIQMGGALSAAHERGIVHRDLKPGNIMLTKSGAKILDFGLATWDGDDSLTGSRMVMGTPAYMAPEQREGNPSDCRTDIYSFGRVLYEMFTGTRPAADRKPLSSKPLNKIVGRCLETDPARRWQSTGELVLALEAAGPGAAKNTRKWIVPATAVFAIALLAAYYALRLASKPTDAPKLTDSDTIILADFTNTTGDPVFDGTLRQGLAIQLEQSPFLKIMDDVQVRKGMRLMNVPLGAPISSQIAHDLCVRDAAAATIEGSIGSLGKSFVITIQATTCESGATLAREQVQAEDKEHVLRAVGTAAIAMRAKLGESRSSIQKLNRPMEQVTTGSLEALQSYTAGITQLTSGRFLAARPLFERAVELDPTFAMAYFYIGISFGNAGDMVQENEFKRKAFALIDHVSEFERHMIAGGYYEAIRDADKDLEENRLGIANYPRVWSFHNTLSENYINLGRFEEGIKEGQAALQLQPDAEPPYRRLLDGYLCLDQLGEAKKIAAAASKAGIGGARIHQRLLEMAYIEEDPAAAEKETSWFAGKPEEYISFGLQAAHKNVLGQRTESTKLYKRAAETALRDGLPDVAAGFEEADARAAALSGNCAPVRRLGRSATALAICGDTTRAEKLAAETSKMFPNGTIWNAVELPGIRAAIESQHSQAAKAVELLQSASPYERAYPEAIYLRGQAYLRLHKGADAAAEFSKILDHKGASWASTWRYPNWGLHYAISYLGLARSLALAGDTAKSRKAYENLFALWKDADTDLPVLAEARNEYAKLP